jgi:hypothetical protein
LEQGSAARVGKHARVAVATSDLLSGRDIAYWYPVDPSEDADVCHGDLVYITSQLTASKHKPDGQAACICGVVVSPSQPWATVGQPLPGRPCCLVCIKGQVPVNVAPVSTCGRSRSLPSPGDVLVPHCDVPGACAVLPCYASSDSVVAQVVSTSVAFPQLGGNPREGTVRVLAHVHMPAVQVGPRYEGFSSWFVPSFSCEFECLVPWRFRRWSHLCDRAVCCPVKARKSVAHLVGSHMSLMSLLTMVLSLLVLHACTRGIEVCQPSVSSNAPACAPVVVCTPVNGVLVCSSPQFSLAGDVVVSQPLGTQVSPQDTSGIGEVSAPVVMQITDLDLQRSGATIGFGGAVFKPRVSPSLAVSASHSSMQLVVTNASACAVLPSSLLDSDGVQVV